MTEISSEWYLSDKFFRKIIKSMIENMKIYFLTSLILISIACFNNDGTVEGDYHHLLVYLLYFVSLAIDAYIRIQIAATMRVCKNKWQSLSKSVHLLIYYSKVSKGID